MYTVAENVTTGRDREKEGGTADEEPVRKSFASVLLLLTTTRPSSFGFVSRVIYISGKGEELSGWRKCAAGHISDDFTASGHRR